MLCACCFADQVLEIPEICPARVHYPRAATHEATRIAYLAEGRPPRYQVLELKTVNGLCCLLVEKVLKGAGFIRLMPVINSVGPESEVQPYENGDDFMTLPST